MLVKSAYTGIAASIIDRKTLQVTSQILLNGQNHSHKVKQKLVRFWQDKQYLIIDEKSMVSHRFLS